MLSITAVYERALPSCAYGYIWMGAHVCVRVSVSVCLFVRA